MVRKSMKNRRARDCRSITPFFRSQLGWVRKHLRPGRIKDAIELNHWLLACFPGATQNLGSIPPAPRGRLDLSKFSYQLAPRDT
jgi:hypothetical protein